MDISHKITVIGLTELFWTKLFKKSHHSLTLPLRWCILGFKPRTGNRFLYPSVIGLEGTSHVEWYSKTRTCHFMFSRLRNIPSSRMSTWRSCDLSRYNQRLRHLTWEVAEHRIIKLYKKFGCDRLATLECWITSSCFIFTFRLHSCREADFRNHQVCPRPKLAAVMIQTCLSLSHRKSNSCRPIEDASEVYLARLM